MVAAAAAVVGGAILMRPGKGCPHSRDLNSTSTFKLNRSSNQIMICRNGSSSNYSAKSKKLLRLRTSAAIAEVSASISSSQVEITWQIIVGSLAGVTPFVVAGIEFSKRIVQQRVCQVCNGSGLILKDNDKSYIRCPGCGGFLPWQSWKRFFTG